MATLRIKPPILISEMENRNVTLRPLLWMLCHSKILDKVEKK